MPIFDYSVRDDAGASSTGQIEVSDPDELRRVLRNNQLYLVKYNSRSGGKTASKAAMGRAPKAEEIVVALRQLSTLLGSGLPVIQSIQIAEAQVVSPSLKLALGAVRSDVASGSSISGSMHRHPRVFSQMITSLVEAGELLGTVDAALDLAADQVDREEALRKQIKTALLYPKFIMIVCGLAAAAMMLMVVPVFKTVYDSMQAELPLPTRVLIGINGALISYGWIGILLGIGALAWFRRYRQTETGRRKVDRWILRLPVIGIVARKVAISRVIQTLSDSTRGGVPVLQALTVAGNTAGNQIIADAIVDVTSRVREGARLGEELEKSGEFPPMVTQMVGAGEVAGNLDQMLDQVARFYRRDVEYAITSLTKLIEPAVTVVVGLMVLLMLVALYMPVFNMSSVLSAPK